jgi:hypothetical protein
MTTVVLEIAASTFCIKPSPPAAQLDGLLSVVGLVEATLDDPHGNLGSTVEPKPPQDRLDMIGHRAFGERQLLRDQGIGQPFSDQTRNFLLAAHTASKLVASLLAPPKRRGASLFGLVLVSTGSPSA